MNKRTIFALFTFAALVLGSVLSLAGQPVAAQDHSPAFSVFVDSNHVKGWDWPLEVQITMEIDDPATPQDPDYSEVQYAFEVPGSINEVHFGPGDAFQMHPGQSVTLTGGGYTKETIITYLALDGVDMLFDSLWGNSDPGAVIEVKNFHNRDIVRWETADSTGFWKADFSVFGDETGEQLLDDFSLGTRYMIFRNDDDGDKTQLRDWSMPFPSMQVLLTQNAMTWWDWPSGYMVDIGFDDPTTPANPDYSITVEPERPNPSEPNCGCLPLGDDYRVLPGHTVTMSNGFLTKVHTVETFQVTSFNYDEDLICGTGEPGSELGTELRYWDYFAQRYVTVGEDGTWCVDYSVPGDDDREQNTYDILPFTEGPAWVSDEDGDSTELTFPYNLVAWRDGGHVDGNNWLADMPVTLEIDDPLTSAEPDYTDSAKPSAGPYVLSGVQFEFNGLFDLQPGHVVRFTQGDWLKELVVSSDLALLEINYLADTVRGVAAPGAHILTIYGYGGASRVTIANSSYNWLVDYAVPGDHVTEDEIANLLPGDNVMAAESDQDGDTTNVSRRVTLPWIDAGKTFDDLVAVSFARGGTVTVMVDDPATPIEPDYSTSVVIGDQTAPWDDQVSYQPIDLPDGLDLQTGTIVTISDTDVSKQVVLSDHEIMDVNLVADQVSGTATPGTELRLLLFNEGVVVARRGAVADGTGAWSVSFADPGPMDWEQDSADILPGSRLTVSHFDEDSDRTRVDWSYNQPPIITDIQVPSGPVPVNISVDVSAGFSDPDPGDMHSAVWDWGDGTTSHGVVDQSAGHVSGSHTYTEAGVYTLELALCDAAGECDQLTYQYLIVYDPNGGFVTGGGWIDSPAGAYRPDPSLIGKATFGFVSKYKKGADVPEGNTEFQFKAGGLNFHSTHYKWLVVTGSNFAKFMGKGTINGEGINGDLYRFQIWAGDNTPDTFRIKIWWEDTEGEHIVYDNGMNQAIGGGSIVIHTK